MLKFAPEILIWGLYSKLNVDTINQCANLRLFIFAKLIKWFVLNGKYRIKRYVIIKTSNKIFKIYKTNSIILVFKFSYLKKCSLNFFFAKMT